MEHNTVQHNIDEINDQLKTLETRIETAGAALRAAIGSNLEGFCQQEYDRLVDEKKVGIRQRGELLAKVAGDAFASFQTC